MLCFEPQEFAQVALRLDGSMQFQQNLTSLMAGRMAKPAAVGNFCEACNGHFQSAITDRVLSDPREHVGSIRTAAETRCEIASGLLKLQRGNSLWKLPL
jgi:hypothetical protein